MRKNKWFGLALVATMMGASFSACSNEAEEVLAQESEIRLTSEITPSRVTSLDYQSTQIVEGQQVGVTITGAKSEHKNVAWTAGANGALSNSGDAIYYGNGTATITAYHPYNASWIGTSQTFSVNTDQSTNIGYLASDLLWVTKTATKSEEAVALTFAHKLAKINVTLVPEYKEMDLSEATISICNTKTSTTIDLSDGTVPTEATGEVQEIIAGTGTTASAIIAPQAIAANTKFIKVELGEKTFYYTLNVDKELKSGYSHNYTLTVKEAALEITNSSEIEDWEDDNNSGDAEEENNNTSTIKTVNNETAGELATLLTQEEKENLTSLKITGYLNSDDIRLIREMAGGADNLKNAVSGSTSNNGSLVSLDISGCTVIEGGNSYFQGWSEDEKYSTAENNLGWYAFAYTNIEKIKLPTTITTLGYKVLGATKITEITIPNSVTSFDAGYLFGETETLTKVHLPIKLTKWAYGALSMCTNLKTITVDKDSPFFEIAEDGLVYLKEANSLSLYCCPGANNSATIKSGTTSILYDAFAWSNITSITIPKSIDFIGWGAFRKCNNLVTITMESSTPPSGTGMSEDGTMELTPFVDFDNFDNCTLKIPAGSKDNYNMALGWKDFTNIVEY